MWIAVRLGFLIAVLAAEPASAAVSVVVSPGKTSLPANGSQQFTAQVFGSANQTVRWEVNGVPGGAPSIGVISDTGLYTAPPDAPKLLSVKVKAEPAAAPASPGTANVAVAARTKSGTNYYVATTGVDTKTGGTKAKPWLTMNYALANVPAGAQILVETGVYNELVTITRSGSAAAGFISLEAAPGAHPIIDGSKLGIPNQENGLITISNASWVRVKGFELRDYVSNSTSVPIGIYVVGAGDHIEILDNHIHNVEETLKTSVGDALGILIYGTAKPSINWLAIDGNELYDLTLGFSESLSLSGNVELWQVTNNIIHDNDNIGVNIEGFFGTDTVDPSLDQARRGLVANNVVYNITSINNPAYGNSLGADGLYVDGGTLVTLQDNLVHDTDYGIELASEVAGKTTNYVWAHDNIVHHSNLSGITIGGAGAKANGGTTDCFIANNTLYSNDSTQSGSGEFQVQFNARNNLFVDNILSANDQGLLVNAFDKTGPPGTLDHNLYFSTGDSSGDPWIWLNQDYVTLSAFHLASGQDGQSKFADPDFISAAKGDFGIPSKSPAVARGEIVGLSTNGLLDYAGNPRTLSGTIDAGALQH